MAACLKRWRGDCVPLAEGVEDWLRTERSKLSRSSPVSEAIDYMFKRWEGFTTFLHDGRIRLTNNAAERALCGFALGKTSWLFAGSNRGSDRAAFMTTPPKTLGHSPNARLVVTMIEVRS